MTRRDDTDDQREHHRAGNGMPPRGLRRLWHWWPSGVREW
ncbi:hypothetical protein BZL29_1757 [Mycobacterium kansasii]|uniref:Uncharacterized protein n=1 Tax=Mycobacterium kansasii TaxID=1768 RepID=A0A1V3XLS0_MYCKA|nr:hypothetical protein BZL29_1757 [Mycobacterium kansasii]